MVRTGFVWKSLAEDRGSTRSQEVGMPAMPVIYRHSFVLASCLDAIQMECRKARFRETGGPLVGYVSPARAVVISEIGGPGPRATLTRHSVTIDGEHAQKFCNRAYRLSNGRVDYVGDWHRHTGLSLAPSKEDSEAMKTMANFAHCPIKNPISLIYRRWPVRFKMYVLNCKGVLEEIGTSILKHMPLAGDYRGF
jgi:integrative and conjugative element protein (TIGR02256 family)